MRFLSYMRGRLTPLIRYESGTWDTRVRINGASWDDFVRKRFLCPKHTLFSSHSSTTKNAHHCIYHFVILLWNFFEGQLRVSRNQVSVQLILWGDLTYYISHYNWYPIGHLAPISKVNWSIHMFYRRKSLCGLIRTETRCWPQSWIPAILIPAAALWHSFFAHYSDFSTIFGFWACGDSGW